MNGCYLMINLLGDPFPVNLITGSFELPSASRVLLIHQLNRVGADVLEAPRCTTRQLVQIEPGEPLRFSDEWA